MGNLQISRIVINSAISHKNLKFDMVIIWTTSIVQKFFVAIATKIEIFDLLTPAVSPTLQKSPVLIQSFSRTTLSYWRAIA